MEAAAKNGSLAQLKLSMKLEGPVRKESLVFRFNGEDLTSGAVVDQDGEKLRITYLLDGPPLRQGTKLLESSLKEAAPAAENPVETHPSSSRGSLQALSYLRREDSQKEWHAVDFDT